MKKLFILPILFFLIIKAHAFQTSYDINLSPQCGAENLCAVHFNIERADKYLFNKIKINPENNWKMSMLLRFERFLEVNVIWQPINNYLLTVQHEFFGHGYRIRDLGKNIACVTKYKINMPFPYGKGGGYTLLEYNKMTPFHDSAISIAGMEANSIFAKEIKLNWLKEGSINPLQSSLYLHSFHDLTLYSLITTKNHYSGNDINSYIDSLSDSYPGKSLSLHKLKRNVVITNLLDPFTYFSLYGTWNYILTGNSTEIPMIKIKNLKFLPAFRYGLTPFGPEIYFENYLCNQNGPIYLYLKQGKYWKNKYFGLGFQAPYLFVKKNLSCGMKCDIWHQPQLLGISKAHENIDNTYFYDFDLSDLRKKRFGGSLAFMASYGIKKLPLSFNGSLGYKLKGFVPGESLWQAPIIRFGLSGNF